jgi:phenylacetate-CoA ligase
MTTERVAHPLCSEDQLALLKRRAERAYERIPFWRSRWQAAGFDPSQLTSYADLVKLPPVTKPEVIADQEAEPPFGSQLAAPAEEIVRMHCNAGSQYLWWTEADMDAVTELFASNFRTMGVRRTDVVDVSSTFHWLMAGTKMDPALRRLGAAVIPGGPGMSELRMKIMREAGVTVLEAFTPYAEELASRFADYGIDPVADLKVRLLLIGGELRQREARARLERAWGGVTVREFYGASEAGMAAAECFDVGDGMHINPMVVVEVVDPDTGAQVELGQPGEVVLTELYRTAQPFFRYQSGDLTEGLILEPCACGRTTPRLRRILGRTGEFTRVKGMFVTPALMEQIVRGRVGVTRWQIQVKRTGTIDEMRVQIESGDTGDAAVGLCRSLVKDIKGAIGLTCVVETIASGTLPEDAPRIDDLRDLN